MLAVRLEYKALPEFDETERWYVVEVFPTYPAPPLHPDLVLSDTSQVRNDAPYWVYPTCYMTLDFIYEVPPPRLILDQVLIVPPYPPVLP